MVIELGRVIMTTEEYEKYQYSFEVLKQEIEAQSKENFEYRKENKVLNENYYFVLNECNILKNTIIELKNIIKVITKNFS